jgi:hypothetical protein
MRTTAVTVGVLLLAGCVSQPEPGAERGRCRPQGACNEGLTCLSDVCVKVPEDLCAKQAPKAGAGPASQPVNVADARGPLSEAHLATARRLLKEARVAYIRGKHQQAAQRAKQVLQLDPDNAMATQIVGASSCYLKDVDQARWAYSRLPSKTQAMLKDICRKAGIELEQ